MKSKSNDSACVTAMYVQEDTLSIRIGLHEKYSVNKQGFDNWIFEHYRIRPDMHILELGCGTGKVWRGREYILPKGVSILLTDLSPLMIEMTRKELGEHPAFSFGLADIQHIPFEGETFDMVIANHMLYHVPDLDRGIAEVHRVLKPGGTFCASTIGEHSMRELQDIYQLFSNRAQFVFSGELSFTLDNGAEKLAGYFQDISKEEYNDALVVTSVDDLMAYILSYNTVPNETLADFKELLQSRFVDGALRISKEQGLFICQK